VNADARFRIRSGASLINSKRFPVRAGLIVFDFNDNSGELGIGVFMYVCFLEIWDSAFYSLHSHETESAGETRHARKVFFFDPLGYASPRWNFH
jgi:hypothetical protein